MVLVLPGMTDDRRGLVSGLTAVLATLHRVIAIDNRDAGESDPEPEGYTLTALGNNVVILLDALEIDQKHVVGYSMGRRGPAGGA